MTKARVIAGWHILATDAHLGNGDDRIPRINEWERAVNLEYGDDEIWITDIMDVEICCTGMHACTQLIDAGNYISPYEGRYVCRVVVTGKIAESDDKFAGLYRKILWYVKLSKRESRVLRRLSENNTKSENFIRDLPKNRRSTKPLKSERVPYQKPRGRKIWNKTKAVLYSGTKLQIEYGNWDFPCIETCD